MATMTATVTRTRTITNESVVLKLVNSIDPVDFMAIPLHRRRQSTAVAIWACLIPMSYAFFFFLCSIPRLWPLILTYLFWAIMFDDAPNRGGRPNNKMRRLPFWDWFAGYYPASIVKEVDLPTDKTYVFGYHPHGIIGMGAFATFATEATGFGKLFPGIKPHLLTLASNFKIPLFRDILMSLGICSVSKKSCMNILSQGPGSAITIVIGGATESLSARPGTADLTLRKRLGFIKVAIQQGASLVPVFSFGENDIYDQLANEKGTAVYSMQKKFQDLFGFTLPLFHGRGLLTYNFGLLPFRHPIVVAVGRPIHVEQHPNPSKEMVLKVQEQYIAELERVWNKYKDVYAKQRKSELILID